jgi:uncharacterized membrane protein
MNDAHYHLILNHFPIIFPLVGIIILITGLISKSNAVKRTAYLFFILAAITAFFAMNSGEEAEEIVEKLNGAMRSVIHNHEEAAETFALLLYVLGGISLVGLWASFKEKTFSKYLDTGSLVFAITTLYFAQQTGATGGEIRHTEIRNSGQVTITKNSAESKKDSD